MNNNIRSIKNIRQKIKNTNYVICVIINNKNANLYLIQDLGLITLEI